MHFQSTLLALALALTATAIPNPAPPADRIAPEVPASSPTTPSPTVTPTPNPSPSPDNRDWPKFQSNPQDPNQGQHHTQDKEKCPDLCSLMAEACTIAVPNDEAFCWTSYKECSYRCEL